MRVLALAVMACAAGLMLACEQTGVAQTAPPAAPAVAPAGPDAGPTAATPEVRDLLTMLHDRKDSLKDFTAKIDYSVSDKTGGVTGKRGKVDFLIDPVLGPKFSADFNRRVVDENGKEKVSEDHVQFIFDGRDFTIKDMGMDGKSRNFARSTVLPPGAKPGDAVTLNGAITLPIGLDVEDVLRTFVVTMGESKDANRPVLKLVPRAKGKFDYTLLEVTVDKKMQLPVVLAQSAADGSVTTITLTEIKINSGEAKMLDASTPAAQGWAPITGGP